MSDAVDGLISVIREQVDAADKIDLTKKMGQFGAYEREVLDRTKTLVRSVGQLELQLLPQESLEYIRQQLVQVKQNFEDLAKSATKDSINQAGRTLVGNYHAVYTVILTQIVLSAQLATKEGTSLVDTLSTLQQYAAQTKQLFDQYKRTLDINVEQVEGMYAKAVVAKHAGNFNQEASNQLFAAKVCLGIAVAFAIAIYWYVEVTFAESLTELIPVVGPSVPMSLVLQIGLSKAVVVSLLTYGLVVTVRNFSACLHNHVLNTHRRNALSTFETFVESTQDQQTKDAILRTAADAVFKPQATGYLKSGLEPAQPSNIVEVIQGLTERK